MKTFEGERGKEGGGGKGGEEGGTKQGRGHGGGEKGGEKAGKGRRDTQTKKFRKEKHEAHTRMFLASVKRDTDAPQ